MIPVSGVDLENVKDFISQVDIFNNLGISAIEDIAECMKLYSFVQDEPLITKNKPGKYMMIISEGSVVVDLGQTKIALEKNDIVGEMSLLSGQLSTANVIASSAAKAFAIHRYDFQNLTTNHAEFASAIESLVDSRNAGS